MENTPGSSRGRNSTFKKQRKHALYKKQRGLCTLCKQSVSYKECTIDHKMPLVRGGTWRLRNLQITCDPCNKAKGTMTNIEYMGTIGVDHV